MLEPVSDTNENCDTETEEDIWKDLPTLCAGCETDLKVSWCNRCDITLCNECWDKQAAHKGKHKRQSGLGGTHQKTDLRIRDILHSILHPVAENEQDGIHWRDYNSKWFGVSSEGEVASLSTTNRYRELTMDADCELSFLRYPSLISFIGETGAGKSTLISALIKSILERKRPIETPVVGNYQHLDTPTSGDVHLFSDPSSWQTDRPILYADCEGLEGGNKIPVAVKAMHKVKSMFDDHIGHHRFRHSKVIGWATGEKTTRAWMTKHFYPRFLFTFSDVVVYVTKNFRTIETVIIRLIEWADRVLQTSVNQPMLPYAIIVINALETDLSTDSSEWFSEDLTNIQLNKHADCINTHKGLLSRLVKDWNDRGKNIKSLRDLINCYYFDMRIICIPHMISVPTLIQQYQKLQIEIETATKRTRQKRIEAELLMNDNELDLYFGYAFDHFSLKPDEPFNFLNAAFHHNPVQSTFKDHITRTASYLISTYQTSSDITESGSKIFNQLGRLVASSILLDACRKRYPQITADVMKEYGKLCDDAEKEFFNCYWPCSYRDKKDRRCVNVATKHHKGHQIEKGVIVATGEYISDRETDSDARARGLSFVQTVVKEYEFLLRKLKRENSQSCEDKVPSRSAAAEIQRNILASDPYEKLWASPTGARSSHRTCLGCLFSTPSRVLPCGHLICDDCVYDFSENNGGDKDGESLTIRDCPLCGGRDTLGKPWTLKQEPRQAAPRVLSLDGGGVRSIVQLKILATLEKIIGLGLPIREFFDLIVGTSAGGIVALGLGMRRMTTDQCLQMFREFANAAFTGHPGSGFFGIGILVEMLHESKYMTTGMEEVLQKTFGEGRIFGEAQEDSASEKFKDLKVGVTLTSSSGHPFYVANYTRPMEIIGSGQAKPGTMAPGYEFFRAETKDSEMKIWEAARATSAAPRYFEAFEHKPTGRFFCDGALTNNNPAHIASTEAEYLWPEHKHRPDIFLSIGTGAGESAREEVLDSREANPRKKSSRGPLKYLKRLKAIVTLQVELSMDCQKAWDDFTSKRPYTTDAEGRQRYHRLNMKYSRHIPNLQDVGDFPYLKEEADRFCSENDVTLREIADKLVASLFYLQLVKVSTELNDRIYSCEGWNTPLITVSWSLTFQGTIHCRLESGSVPLWKLCEKLMKYSESNGLPIFALRVGEGQPPAWTSPKEPIVQFGRPFEVHLQFSVPLKAVDDPIQISMINLESKYSPTLISGLPATLNQLRALMPHHSGMWQAAGFIQGFRD
ncbi:hypothetical protein K440DRAFT_569550 [Wilcoxina mikolae CBS 423.85]|nr:hypothetical protein K440DRAFT_569550 [Wilcoxina mikolae CBS 423.85]